MTVSSRGFGLICRYEQYRLEAYDDGTGVWTIGWGCTRNVGPGMKITMAEANRLLHEDVAAAEGALDRYVTVPLSQSMRDAITSFIFNLGAGAFRGSTLRRKLNAGDYLACPSELLRWHKTPGAELGLLRRRVAEAALFLEDPLPRNGDQ